MATTYIALGSNLGDRRSHLEHALTRLADVGRVEAGSPIYETDPVGGPPDQPAYLNAVVRLGTELTPDRLLLSLEDIERERGRTREVRWEARTLDLDILRYGDLTLASDGLVIPHPEIRNRAFVLAPMTDVEPGLGDGDGSYVQALDELGAAGLRRISGPVDPAESRWMMGLADAVELEGDGPFHVEAHRDWSNSSGDAFGAFLAACALAAGSRVHPGFRPSDFAYRFVHPVPPGASLTIDVEELRSSAAASELRIQVWCEGRVCGTSAVSLVSRPSDPVVGPPMPRVVGRDRAIPAYHLVEAAGRTPGRSLHSWTPLERWDLPDLASGSEDVLRAWSPNVTFGNDRPDLIAASMLMPIDALMWPAALQRRGDLPFGSPIATPTIDLTVRYATMVSDPWYVAEAKIDHEAGRSMAGTVRVWGSDGSYGAVGHSLNLVLGGASPTDGL